MMMMWFLFLVFFLATTEDDDGWTRWIPHIARAMTRHAISGHTIRML